MNTANPRQVKWYNRLAHIRWRTLSLIFAFTASALSLLTYWYHPVLLERLDLLGRDIVFRLRQAPPPSPDVAVVAVDEKSVKKYGRWPWPRALQGRLIRELKQQGASVIALDIIYLRPQDVAQDMALAEALASPGAPVTGGFFFRSAQSVPPDPESVQILRQHRISIIHATPGARFNRIISFPFVETNQAEIVHFFNTFGFFNYIPDPDGIVRSAPLVLGFQGDFFASLPVAALSLHLNRQIQLEISQDGVAGMRIGKLEIPLDSRGCLALNFYNGRKPLSILSASDVLDHRLKRGSLQGKVVFTGVTETGIADVRPTPVDPAFPGVAIHATVASNILQNFYLYQDNRTVIIDVLLMALVPLLMVRGMARLRKVTFMAATYVGVLCILWLIFYTVVSSTGLLISIIYPSTAATIGYLLIQSFHVLVTQRHSRYLKQAFSTYVSSALVDTLIKNPDAFKMSGEKKEITVLFSDIRGFTSLSEQLPPEELVTILNRYLGPMTDSIMEEQGTLDKYIGDAIMALFNAPLDVEDHAIKAVRSAIKMLENLARLNLELQDEFGITLKSGIGIHTGEAVIGNMGSRRRFDYTAIGDTVNLASRLEGRTKAYGVDIIISGDTCRQLRDWFLVRKLDRLRVKGKSEPVEIYQVIPDKNDIQAISLVDMYYKALELYFNGDFAKALEAFEKIIEKFGNDRPSAIMAERCRQYLRNPPAPPWNGVYVAQDK